MTDKIGEECSYDAEIMEAHSYFLQYIYVYYY